MFVKVVEIIRTDSVTRNINTVFNVHVEVI